jgi:hypothetical protein
MNGLSAYAMDAVSWAVNKGLITGNGTSYGWQDTVTKEQVAAIFYRFTKLPK